MPITRPRASNSGPPELPWLIGASVWIASTSWYSDVSAEIERCVAETTPTESDVSAPNGLPIAATGSPTVDPRRVAERKRRQRMELRIDAEDADVVEHVPADDLRRHDVAVAELDEDLVRARRRRRRSRPRRRS